MNKISTNVHLDRELSAYKEKVEQIRKKLGLKGDFHLLGSVLKERIAYKRAISEGLGISEYSDSKAKGEFESFFSEFAKAVKMPLNLK